jgi:mono/diheme cytochrome c family protein
MGDGGVGPQFVDNPFLLFSDYVVGRILLGGGEMPAFADELSDAQIAAVANYVAETWGAHPLKVSPEQVTAERKKIVPGPKVADTAGDVGPPP